ncbi:TnsA endonuclease N-terminal domain-containing protein [Burkholderia pyrrocinia]|uniref:TnsA endonuclease N-terminal domain-containing protein n=1 Tax=Burkholderia pyrrocinia TaxID=60550 RepID=UPI002AB09F74|nr:TnsA endonuclease N-terminal domain-containing protein [Burkholderia pyrrocinia]
MARGVKRWTESLIDQRQREQYGEGTGSAYKPWIKTADFPSRGRIRRAYSPKFGRTIHLMSDVEWHTFLLLEYANSIDELYEQFPMERDVTLQIAAALGIAHPYYPGTHVPAVMTLDFLAVSHRTGNVRAFDVKTTREAENTRAIEKLEIARTYCMGRNVAHHLVFDSALPMVKVRNIEWMRSGFLKEGEVEPYPGYYLEKAQLMASELSNANHDISLSQYCAGFDSRHGLESGVALRAAKILLWERTLRCDLNNPDLSSAPLLSFLRTVPRSRNRTAGTR